jgi:hypothetical protein
MGNAISNSVNNAVRAIKDTISNILHRFAPPIIRYIIAHPIRTLGHIVSGLLLIAPGAVTGPLLALIGFGRNGIIAGEGHNTIKNERNYTDVEMTGSVAASAQSAMGTISAGSTFAVLQSAAVSRRPNR